MHFSDLSTYQTALSYQFTFHPYNQQFFINRDYFGNEGYTTVEICLMPGAAYTLRKSGVVRLHAWEAGCLGFNLLLSSSVTSVRYITSLSLNAFIGKVKLMRRVVRIKGVHKCLGSHLASADQGWFLSPLYDQCSAEYPAHRIYFNIYCQMNKCVALPKKSYNGQILEPHRHLVEEY